MTVLTENRVFALLTELASCLCAQIDDPGNGLTGVCFCGIMPGDQVPFDYVGDCTETMCGMATVRLTQTYPAAAVGQPYIQPGNCGSQLGVDIQLGIWRCAPMPDANGELPSSGDMLSATQDQIADMFALIMAVQCCLSLSPLDYILGAYLPQGPMGGVVGGSVTLQTVI